MDLLQAVFLDSSISGRISSEKRDLSRSYRFNPSKYLLLDKKKISVSPFYRI